MSIRQLPEDVVDKIRSASTITSLKEVASGLLKNSLDARACKVNVYLDCVRGNCTVEDDGHGIAPADFSEDAQLSKAYGTSKYPPNPCLHGKRGTFLASLAALSLMTVTSHHHTHNSHNSLTAHHGKIIRREIGPSSKERFEVFDHGTRVSVHNLFGSMPVRVKQRATLTATKVGIEKEWNLLVTEILALLLSWPTNISVFLREVNIERELRLKSTSNADTLIRTSRLLSHVLPTAVQQDNDSWVPVSASAGQIKVKGCIHLTPVASRKFQYLSLGIMPILDEFGNNILYETINKVFKNSSFGIVESEEKPSQKPRKGIDRWPVFYLRITLNGSNTILDSEDPLNRPPGETDKILNLLKVTSYGFLKKHHFRPAKVHLPSDDSVFSTTSTSRRSKRVKTSSQSIGSTLSQISNPATPASTLSFSESPFSGWSRIKVGLPKASAPFKKPEVERLLGNGGELLRRPFSDVDFDSSSDSRPKSNASKANSAPLPLRPSLNRVDTSTTQSSDPDQEGTLTSTSGSDEITNGTGSDQKGTSKPSKLLQEILDSWVNPVFETKQTSIPALNGPDHRCGGRETGVRFETSSMILERRLSRKALATAEVISQVDPLVMVDQHAADERCRLEDLMASYFVVGENPECPRAVIEALERPVLLEVSEQEGHLLERLRENLAWWGIVYKLEQQQQQQQQQQPRSNGRTQDADNCKVSVTALPPSIIERCRSEPRLLVELLRREAWKLHDEGVLPPQPATSIVKPEVGKPRAPNFYGCPQGIIELLHSRSCRSAIMFNDPLTLQECKALVSRLAGCALPFQCAHGRPSMVPLVDLGLGDRIGDWHDGYEQPIMGVEGWKEFLKGDSDKGGGRDRVESFISTLTLEPPDG